MSLDSPSLPCAEQLTVKKEETVFSSGLTLEKEVEYLSELATNLHSKLFPNSPPRELEQRNEIEKGVNVIISANQELTGRLGRISQKIHEISQSID